MADKYIVHTTIKGVVKKGGKPVIIKRSSEPQEVPSALVKELLDRGVITQVPGQAEASTSRTPQQPPAPSNANPTPDADNPPPPADD